VNIPDTRPSSVATDRSRRAARAILGYRRPVARLPWRAVRQWRARLACLLIAAAAFGCGPRYVVVQRPPRVDLQQFRTVGLLDFDVSDGFPLQREVTHRFLATLQGLQPGVRVLELGSEREVLASIGRDTLDPAGLRAVAERYHVDALLAGELTVSKVKPKVTLGQAGFPSLTAAAQVNGALRASLRDTDAGLTLWTNGAHGSWTLGGAQVGADGRPSIGVSDPQQVYDQMLSELVSLATTDFRPTYEREPVQEGRAAN
jgi:hypothetical protein